MKKKLNKKNQPPSRFLGKVDEHGNIDAVLIQHQNDKNVEKEVPEQFDEPTAEPTSGLRF